MEVILVSIDHIRKPVSWDISKGDTIMDGGKTFRLVCTNNDTSYFFEDATGLREAYDYLKWRMEGLEK